MKKNVKISRTALALIASLAVTVASNPSTAATALYGVSIDTESIAADTQDGTFSVYFELYSGGSPGISNVVSFRNFDFDAAHGGAAGDVGSVALTGDATGDLADGVTLDTKNASNTSNSFTQEFTAGSTLKFQLSTTQNGVDPSTSTPDALSIQILDGGGLAVGTATDDMSSLIQIQYVTPLQIGTYGSDPTLTTTGNQALTFDAPTITLIPEPTSLAAVCLTSGLFLATRTRKRQSHF